MQNIHTIITVVSLILHIIVISIVAGYITIFVLMLWQNEVHTNGISDPAWFVAVEQPGDDGF